MKVILQGMVEAYRFEIYDNNVVVNLPDGRTYPFVWDEKASVAYALLTFLVIYDVDIKWSTEQVFSAVLMAIFLSRHRLHQYSPEHWDTLLAWTRSFQYQDHAVNCALMAKKLHYES